MKHAALLPALLLAWSCGPGGCSSISGSPGASVGGSQSVGGVGGGADALALPGAPEVHYAARLESGVANGTQYRPTNQGSAGAAGDAAFQGYAGNDPYYRTNVVNTHPAWDFDPTLNGGNPHGIKMPNAMYSSCSAATIIVVGRLDSDRTEGALWDFGSSGDAPFHPWGGNGNIFEEFGRTDRPQFAGAGILTSLRSWFIYTVTAAAGAGAYTVHLNGTLLGASTATIGWVSDADHRIGNGGGGGTWKGEIAELVFYCSALSSSDREQAEAFLAYTYGLSL